jgi:TetR/AcrR family transcriptional regulator, transcriptional repressor for nem operon
MITIIHLMGRSRDEKAKSHERIVDIASARIRESGTATPGVAEIMQAAGLTHGGFYKHFGSRDDLVAEAVDRTFAQTEEALRPVTDGAEDPLAAFVDWYLSAEHRDHPAAGCGVVALGGDVVRGDARIRASYTEQVRRYLGHLEAWLDGSDQDRRGRATVMLSTLVGALLVARAVDDPALSDEILADVRAALT